MSHNKARFVASTSASQKSVSSWAEVRPTCGSTRADVRLTCGTTLADVRPTCGSSQAEVRCTGSSRGAEVRPTCGYTLAEVKLLMTHEQRSDLNILEIKAAKLPFLTFTRMHPEVKSIYKRAALWVSRIKSKWREPIARFFQILAKTVETTCC